MTHGFSHICSRGWPCWALEGGEALGPVKAECLSVGECRGGGRGGEYPHTSREKGDGMGVSGGETGKGNNM
jgi:hypothetical protein